MESEVIKIKSNGLYFENIFYQVMQSSDTKPKELFLLLHGFPGRMVKNYDVAEVLALRDYKVIIPHYEGLGLSQGSFGFLSCYNSLTSFIRHVEQGFGEIKNVLGFSWGGLLALSLKLKSVRNMVLMAPLSKIPPQNMTNLDCFIQILLEMEEDVFPKAMTKNIIESDLNALQSFLNLNVAKYRKTNLSTLILHGSSDDVIDFKDSEELLNKLGDNAFLKRFESDHLLSNVRMRVYEEILKFLIKE